MENVVSRVGEKLTKKKKNVEEWMFAVGAEIGWERGKWGKAAYLLRIPHP